MKKGLFLFLVILMVIVSLGKKEEILALEDPHPELFSVFYEGDGYSILKRTEIDELQAYTLIAFHIDDGTDICTVSSVHKINYRVLYNDKYYDIVQGVDLELYTCAKLIELEII